MYLICFASFYETFWSEAFEERGLERGSLSAFVCPVELIAIESWVDNLKSSVEKFEKADHTKQTYDLLHIFDAYSRGVEFDCLEISLPYSSLLLCHWIVAGLQLKVAVWHESFATHNHLQWSTRALQVGNTTRGKQIESLLESRIHTVCLLTCILACTPTPSRQEERRTH